MATVLISEENDLLRCLLAVALRGAGHTVLDTADAALAQRKFAANPVDIVIAGYGGKGCANAELVGRIRQLDDGVAIVMVTGTGDTLPREIDTADVYVCQARPWRISFILKTIAHLATQPRTALVSEAA